MDHGVRYLVIEATNITELGQQINHAAAEGYLVTQSYAVPVPGPGALMTIQHFTVMELDLTDYDGGLGIEDAH